MDALEWCCTKVELYPDIKPGKTFGSFKDEDDRNEWTEKNCDELVGGPEKDFCPGNLSLNWL